MVRVPQKKKKQRQDEAQRRRIVNILMTPGVIIKIHKPPKNIKQKQKKSTHRKIKPQLHDKKTKTPKPEKKTK